MDGLPGLEKAFLEAFRKAKVQRCQVHKAVNVLTKVRRKDRNVIAHEMRKVFYAADRLKAKCARVVLREVDEVEGDLSGCCALRGEGLRLDCCLPGVPRRGVDASSDDQPDRAAEQGIQAKDKADGDRGRRSLGLHAAPLRGDEDRSVVEERPVSKLRFSKAQALRAISHTKVDTTQEAYLMHCDLVLARVIFSFRRTTATSTRTKLSDNSEKGVNDGGLHRRSPCVHRCTYHMR